MPDTAVVFMGRTIQHLTRFDRDTVGLSCPTPDEYAGFYKWRGFTISRFYNLTSECVNKGMYVAILSPVTMFAKEDSLAVYTDRLLLTSFQILVTLILSPVIGVIILPG